MKQTATIYGKPPKDLGFVDLSPKEMMFWLYLPVKIPNSSKLSVPPNLLQFHPIISLSCINAVRNYGHDYLDDKYVYISAKVMHISPGNPGNRPGWHSDGFLSEDLNYIWADCSPTYFWEPRHAICLPEDHIESIKVMEDVCESTPEFIKTYPDKHLLRLDQTVLHRVGDVRKPMVRSFVKISISKDKYDLVGNSINHDLNLNWKYYERSQIRNHPHKAGGDTSGMMQ
jgi:hypothetical protein